MSGANSIGFGRRLSVLLAVMTLCLMAWTGVSRAANEESGWHRSWFPNVTLTDQNGRHLRFYDDMIRGKVVAINFIYTQCTSVCPLDTAQMRRVQQILGDRVGRDVHMYSISINRDTPASLSRYMRTYDVGPGWTFLTGSRADVELLQRRLGIHATDPRNLGSHDTSIMLGNEVTSQWIKRSSFENPQNIAVLLGDTLNNYTRSVGNANRVPYQGVGQISDTSQGIYLFRTRCASCHTIGQGDSLGPDLQHVTSQRDPAWLQRWIQHPDRMIAQRDPIAMALMRRYHNLPMPNLSLGDSDARALIRYLREQDQRATQAAAQQRPAR